MKKLFSSYKKAFNKAFIWHMIGITLNALYPILLIIFVTRYNGISNSGLFSLTFYLASFFSTITAYGGRIYHVSDVQAKYSDSQYVTLRYFTSSIMLFIAFMFCVINYYDISKASLFFIFLFFRVFESISDSYYGIMQKNNDLVSIGKSFTIKSIISCIMFIILDLITRNIIISSLAIAFSNYLIMKIYDKRIISKYSHVKTKMDIGIGKLLKECFPIFVFSFLQLFLINITRYVADIFLSNEIQGYFGILIAPASIIALIAQFAIQPSVRSLSELLDKKEYNIFKTNIKRINISLMFVGVIISLLTYLIGSEALSYIYNLDLTQYKLLLTFIVMGGMLYGLSFIYSTILTILRSFKSQLYIYIVSIIFSIIVSIIFINKWGLNGALYAFFISMVFQFVLFGIYYFIKTKIINNINSRYVSR
ncbi:MAG: hypothetical protein WC343_00565 [Bacilli bacterium]|jgi:O-antigen/teichoic acid export membrane protein